MAVGLLKVNHWVDIAGPNVSAADVAKAMPWISWTIQMTLISIVVITVIDVAFQVRLLAQAKPGHPTQILTAS